MKVNFVKTLISIVIATLLGLLFYSVVIPQNNWQWYALGITTLSLSIPLILAFGLDYNCGNRTVNIKVASWLFVFVSLILNTLFSLWGSNAMLYIVVVSLISVLAIACVVSLYNFKK